ncbi:MAG: IS21 family transposase, partial [Candidatus Dormibacteraceae bacterium]
MQQWGQIQALSAQGMSDAAIARSLGIDRETVVKWRGEPPPTAIQRHRASLIDEYRDYLAQRLTEYPDLSARVLVRELEQRGYQGGYERVKIACRGLRSEAPVEG